MDFDKIVPDWSATGTEPPESLKQSGFEAGYKPPAAYFNWFWNRVSACLSEIRAKLKGHAEDKGNPHGVTAAQVGLGKVNNTADSEKHVAYAGTAGIANKAANQLTIRFNGGGTESTNKWTYDGSTGRSVNITPANIGAAKDDLTNVENADLQSKVASAAVGVPIANAESSDGIAYTATVPGVSDLINGMLLTIIPSMTSTSTNITLNVNSMGAKNVRLPLSFNTAAMDRPSMDTFYVAERPITLQYDANYAAGGIWKVFDKNKTSAQDLYGVVPIESGGTKAKTAEEALENLGAAPKVHTHMVGEVSGAFSASDYDGLIVKSGNPVSQSMKSGRGITAITIYLPKQSGSGEPSPSNVRPISGWTGAVLTRCGKNLLKNTATTNTVNGITFRINSDGSVVVNGESSERAQKIVGTADLPAGDYIASAGFVTDARTAFVVYEVNGKNVYVDLTGYAEKTFTLTEQTTVTYTLDIRNSGVTVNNFVYYPMIRKASTTDSTYAPYQGDTYTADFGKTVYGGTLDWNTGVLTVDRAMVTLTGTEKYTHVSGWQAGSCVIYGSSLPGAVNIPNHSTVAELICSHATAKTTAQLTSTEGIVGVGQNADNLYLSLGAQDKDSLVDYITAQYAAATPVQVAYRLATPTVIQLSPLMIESLTGENTVYSDGDSNVVTFNHDGMIVYIMNRIAALETASVNA